MIVLKAGRHGGPLLRAYRGYVSPPHPPSESHLIACHIWTNLAPFQVHIAPTIPPPPRVTSRKVYMHLDSNNSWTCQPIPDINPWLFYSVSFIGAFFHSVCFITLSPHMTHRNNMSGPMFHEVGEVMWIHRYQVNINIKSFTLLAPPPPPPWGWTPAVGLSRYQSMSPTLYRRTVHAW